MSYGTPTGRLVRALEWSKVEDEKWVAIDGNDNIAYMIEMKNSETYTASYTTPSLRLCSGPAAPFFNLGTYYSLADAQKISEAHESGLTVPIFKPGKLVGWVDKDSSVSLRISENIFQKLFLKTLRCLRIIFIKFRSLVNGE